MLPLLGEKAKNSKQGILERTLGRRDGAVQRKFSAENFRGESENTLRRVLNNYKNLILAFYD